MIEAALLAALAAALGVATAGAVSGPGLGMIVTAVILLTPAVSVGLGALVVMLFTAPMRRRQAALRNKVRGRRRQ